MSSPVPGRSHPSTTRNQSASEPMIDAFWGVVLFLGLGVISGIGYVFVKGSYPTTPILPFLAFPLLSLFITPARALTRMVGALIVIGILISMLWIGQIGLVLIFIVMLVLAAIAMIHFNGKQFPIYQLLSVSAFLLFISAIPFLRLPGPMNATFTKINTVTGQGATISQPVRETLEQRVRRENDFRDAARADAEARREAQAREAIAARTTSSKPQEVIQILPPGGFPTPSFPTATFDAPSSRMPSSAQRAIDSATAKFDARALENSGRFLAAVEASEKHPLHSRLTECRMRIRDPGIVAGREGVQARQQLMDCLSGQR